MGYIGSPDSSLRAHVGGNIHNSNRMPCRLSQLLGPEPLDSWRCRVCPSRPTQLEQSLPCQTKYASPTRTTRPPLMKCTCNWITADCSHHGTVRLRDGMSAEARSQPGDVDFQWLLKEKGLCVAATEFHLPRTHATQHTTRTALQELRPCLMWCLARKMTAGSIFHF